jgi:hypothetical protein
MYIVIWPILGTGRTCLIDWLSHIRNYYYLLPPLRTVFTIIYPKQTMSIWYVKLQLFCTCSFCYMYSYYYYYYYYYYLSPLGTVFIIMYLKRDMFLRYIMSSVFCNYNL